MHTKHNTRLPPDTPPLPGVKFSCLAFLAGRLLSSVFPDLPNKALEKSKANAIHTGLGVFGYAYRSAFIKRPVKC